MSRVRERGGIPPPHHAQHTISYITYLSLLDSLFILQEYFLRELFQIGFMPDHLSEILHIFLKVFILPLLLNDRLNLKLYFLRNLKILLHGLLVSIVAGENFYVSLLVLGLDSSWKLLRLPLAFKF